MEWWDQMLWSSFFQCWVFSFLTVLFQGHLSSFIKRLFSSSLLSVIRVVSSAYLRLLIFLPAILIPICDSSRPALCMMYSTYALNKQGNNRQPCHTPFSILNQSVVPCLVLTVASRSVSRFLRRQVRWSGIPISFRIFHSLLWSTKVFSVVDEAKVDVFWEFPCFFYDPVILMISSAFSKSSLYIWKFLVHILLKPCLKDFEQNLARCEMSTIIW